MIKFGEENKYERKLTLTLEFEFFRDDMGNLRYSCDELGLMNAYASEKLIKHVKDVIGLS